MKLRREDGQALVLGVLLMAAMLGCAALVLDVGSWFRDKRQLQSTADAAALAGAQSLPQDPGGATTLAVQYANANGGGVTAANVTISSVLSPNDTISVRASNSAPGFFAKVFSINSVNVDASAAARSDLPAQALGVAPMVVSDQHPLLKGAGCPCFGPNTSLPYNPLGAPGAFGMLNLDQGGNNPGSSDEGNWIEYGFNKNLPLGQYASDPGAKFSSGNIQTALTDRIGTVLLFPVYHKLTGTGSNAQYDIIGWVGFYLDSFNVQGNNATLYGHFTRYIAKGIQVTTSNPNESDFGVRTIQLVH
jgi:Flp pilus assembly protein TadG